MIVLLLVGVATAAEPSHWVGEWSQDWRRNPGVGYASVQVSDPRDGTVEVSFSEGLGVSGYSDSGRGTITGDELVVTLSQCTLRLHLNDAPKPLDRSLKVGDGCSMGSGGDGPMTLFPADRVRFFTTSFDCTKASTAVEKAVCGDRSLAQVDLALAERYAKARSGEEGDAVRDSQRAWLAQRDATCQSADRACLLASYARRVLALSQGGVDTLTFAALSRLHAAGADRTLRDPVVDAYLGGHTGDVHVDNFGLSATASADSLVFAGCSESGPGYDPLHRDCAQSLYVRLGADNALWVVRREPHASSDFAVYGPLAATADSLPPPVRAWMAKEAADRDGDAPRIEFSAVFP